MKKKIVIETKFNLEEVVKSLNELFPSSTTAFSGFYGFLGNTFLQPPGLSVSPGCWVNPLIELRSFHSNLGWAGHVSNFCSASLWLASGM